MVGTINGELVVQREEGLAILRLNRPERMNSLSPGILDTLASLVPQLAASPGVRAIMITGTGRAFCAGGDVGGMGGAGDRETTLSGMKSYHPWVKALRHSDKIVIAAVNGVAAGGGFGLAMLADVVVAAENCFFKAAFTNLGAAADYGLGFTLPRAVGTIRAAEILFNDRRVSAGEALEIGMISQVFAAETFAEEAMGLARRIAQGPRGAQLTKRLLRFDELDAFTRYLDLEAETQTEAFQTDDFREGVAAFVERRPPRFAGH